MTMNDEKCGARIGEMIGNGERTPLACGLAKGHSGAHVPAVAAKAPALKAVAARAAKGAVK